MKTNAKVFACFVSCVVGYWLTWTPVAIAQSKYPVRPIRVLVGFPAAGATDAIARTIGEQLSKQIGRPVVIDNRPGAGGRLATEMLTGAEPDGYTLLIGTVSLAINPSLHKKLPYDVERDLLPLTRLAEIINVMVVNSSTGVVDIKGFIGWAKKRSDEVSFASSGVGQTGHLAGELFQRLTGIRMMHVSYKGSGPALIDLSAPNNATITLRLSTKSNPLTCAPSSQNAIHSQWANPKTLSTSPYSWLQTSRE